MKSQTAVVLAALVLVCGNACPGMGPGNVQARHDSRESSRWEHAVDSLLALMTLDEKVGQLRQESGQGVDSLSESTVDSVNRARVREGGLGSMLNVFGADATRQIQKVAVGESRLGIPLLFGFDVVHGFRTTFPIPLAEASSWDVAAVERSARIAASEAAAAGIHWTFAPMVDIARDPRWGRIAEGSGEDPFLGSAMAAARVRGFQGKSLRDQGSILACAKHFAAYGGAEGGRDYNTVDMSERTLREIYLPPYRAAVDAGAGTLMSSFNEIAGVPSTGNRALLTGILRNEWGFDGFVVSDWNSVAELHAHGFAATRSEAARRAIEAGTDMDMVGGVYGEELAGLVKAGTVPLGTVDEAVRRVLRVKYRLGLFDDPYRNCSMERQRTMTLTRQNLEAARDVAKKSIVLLKNEGQILPLRRNLGTIAIVGPLAADSVDPLGPWSGVGESRNVVSVLRGIRAAVSPATKVLYAPGCDIDGNDTHGFDEAIAAAQRAEVVIAVVGESSDMSGEASSRSSLDLPGRQEDLIRQIQATGKPVIVILMNGRPLSIEWTAAHIPAILETWFLGLQTGNAVADVVFGDYNPSGKLPVSFPRTVGQVPVYYNHKNTGRPPEAVERFTSKYLDIPDGPLFPFGFGLSYTSFACSDLRLSAPQIAPSDSLKVTVRVKNTGKRPGEEVVQLYIGDEYASVTRPVKELKGFAKVALAPGEEKEVTFTLTPDLLAFYGLDMKREVEPGTIRVYAGTSSVDLLSASFEVVAHPRGR